jgi:hypothetical protein
MTNHRETGPSAMLGNADDLELLRHEFSAGDGSFLLPLWIDLHWDRSAFSRLEQAMRRVCAQQEPREQLARWLVEGYWYLSDFVLGHISHPDFPRLEPAEYYQSAVTRLWDLHNPDFATRPRGERCPSAALFGSQSSKVGRGVGGLAVPLFGFCVLALLS